MKRLILILLISFASFANQTAQAQCAGFCGGYSFVGGCYCDDACWLFGDCCFADVCTACTSTGPNWNANCGPPPPPPPPPCVAAPVPNNACYQLVISLDPTCCNTAWTPACQANYDACTEVSFPYTGAPTSWTVPNCVTSITITAEGAQGGNANSQSGGAGFVPGGLGAVVIATIPANPGDVVDITVGGQGGLGTVPGFNGGGSGFFSTDGNLNNASAGGGGSTNINVNGSPVIIAAGGGGAGGGTWTFSAENNGGGDGGCASGEAPSPGSPWIGVGGGGGTQTAPGVGGAPWAGVPPGGSPGVGGVGGIGGQWQTAPGGGGGGGYFGGGGGGNDGCCTGANGGAGGGGGSSLVPGGGGCTQGTNLGNGVVTIAYIGGGSNATIVPALICEGSTTMVEIFGATGTIQWEVSTDGGVTFAPIPGATATTYTSGPLTANTCYRAEEVGGACTLTPYTNTVCVTVSPMPAPNAGLDDQLCHSTTVGYPLQGTSSGGTITWTMTQGPLGTPGPPSAIYSPNNTNLNATTIVNYSGTYTFTLTETDPTGVCPSATDQVDIFFAEETHTTAFVDPSCNGFTDGSITITSTGNPGAIQYSFDNGATYQASNTLNTFGAGTYTVVSQDIIGCTATSNITITDPPLVVINVSNDTTVCQNGTATVSASATGGTSYSFHWSQTASLAASQSVNPTVPTTVDVFAENQNGCISTTETITISMHGPILLNISPNDTVCPGYVSGASVNAAGGFMGYNYIWTANGSTIPGSINSISTNPAVQTQYCVQVSDGCETTPVNICTNTIMREVPNPVFTSDTTQGCAPTQIIFTNLTPAYLVDSVTWNIEGVITHDLVTATHMFQNIGTYDVYLQVYTPYGCFNSITAADYITVHDYPEAMFYTNPNPTTIFNTEISLTDLSTVGNNTYEWQTPGANPANTTEQNPTVVYPDGIAGDYPVTLIVTSEFNCVDIATAIISIQSDVLIYAPNVFTPDGDEFNEYWKVYMDGIDIYDFHLSVFNRWGEMVFESYNPEGTWDGTYGTTESKAGTYVWVIEAKDPFSDKKYEFRGHVTVLK